MQFDFTELTPSASTGMMRDNTAIRDRSAVFKIAKQVTDGLIDKGLDNYESQVKQEYQEFVNEETRKYVAKTNAQISAFGQHSRIQSKILQKSVETMKPGETPEMLIAQYDQSIDKYINSAGNITNPEAKEAILQAKDMAKREALTNFAFAINEKEHEDIKTTFEAGIDLAVETQDIPSLQANIKGLYDGGYINAAEANLRLTQEQNKLIEIGNKRVKDQAEALVVIGKKEEAKALLETGYITETEEIKQAAIKDIISDGEHDAAMEEIITTQSVNEVRAMQQGLEDGTWMPDLKTKSKVKKALSQQELKLLSQDYAKGLKAFQLAEAGEFVPQATLDEISDPKLVEMIRAFQETRFGGADTESALFEELKNKVDEKGAQEYRSRGITGFSPFHNDILDPDKTYDLMNEVVNSKLDQNAKQILMTNIMTDFYNTANSEKEMVMLDGKFKKITDRELESMQDLTTTLQNYIEPIGGFTAKGTAPKGRKGFGILTPSEAKQLFDSTLLSIVRHYERKPNSSPEIVMRDIIQKNVDSYVSQTYQERIRKRLLENRKIGNLPAPKKETGPMKIGRFEVEVVE